MWSHEGKRFVSRIGSAVGGLLLASSVAGCFQPLYGDHSLGGNPSVRQSLSSVEVQQIAAPRGSPEARVAVELRNALLFDLTGGGAQQTPSHRLEIKMRTTRQAIIVDINTGRYEAMITGINAEYTLSEIGTGKVVAKGSTFSRASLDIPGQQQRFAQARAVRDAEDRAAKVAADQIHTRLASYFLTGT